MLCRVAFLLTMLLPMSAAWIPALDSPGDFVFRGSLESVHTGEDAVPVLRLKISGFEAVVRVAENARLRSSAGRVLTVDELTLGATLEVTADWMADGFVATAVTAPEAEQIGAVGLVEQVEPGRMTVAGLEFELDEDSAPLTANLAAGQMAAVLGVPGSGFAPRATQVISQEQFWIFGRVSARDDAARTLTVATRVIAVPDSTKIVGPDKSPASFAKLAVGMQVSVIGRSSAGKLVADSIRIVEAAGRVEIRGQLITVGAGSIILKTLDTPFEIRTDAKTEIVGTLTAGANVSVSATLQTDGSLLATRIVIQTGKDENRGSEIGFSGVVERVDAAAGVIVASGATIRISRSTVIRSGEAPLTIGDLKAGDKIRVSGTRQADGSLAASRVDVILGTSTANETVFDGAVERVATDGSSITVRGVRVLISAETAIQSGSTSIKASGLKVGDQVKIAGTKQADGSVLASRIVVIPATTPPAESVLDGTVERVATDGSKIVVRGVGVLVSAQTAIQSGGKVIKATDIKVGDQVKIAGTKQADGTVLATRIEVLTSKA